MSSRERWAAWAEANAYKREPGEHAAGGRAGRLAQARDRAHERIEKHAPEHEKETLHHAVEKGGKEARAARREALGHHLAAPKEEKAPKEAKEPGAAKAVLEKAFGKEVAAPKPGKQVLDERGHVLSGNVTSAQRAVAQAAAEKPVEATSSGRTAQEQLPGNAGKATKDALVASKEAEHFRTADAHKEAAGAHMEAAEQHSKNGNDKQADEHFNKALAHEKEAQYLSTVKDKGQPASAIQYGQGQGTLKAAAPAVAEKAVDPERRLAWRELRKQASYSPSHSGFGGSAATYEGQAKQAAEAGRFGEAAVHHSIAATIHAGAGRISRATKHDNAYRENKAKFLRGEGKHG